MICYNYNFYQCSVRQSGSKKSKLIPVLPCGIRLKSSPIPAHYHCKVRKTRAEQNREGRVKQGKIKLPDCNVRLIARGLVLNREGKSWILGFNFFYHLKKKKIGILELGSHLKNIFFIPLIYLMSF